MTMTLMLSSDIAQLCLVIDAGDDSALPALADALEEAGDARAAGMRHDIVPSHWGREASFSCGCHRCPAHQGSVPLETYARLPGVIPEWERIHADGQVAGNLVSYPTRSEAYLALAEALS